MKAKTISPINIAAFFLLAACAVMGVVGLFLAWTGADIAGMGEVKVTLLEYGRVSDVTGGVIPAMTALGSVAAVAMCFAAVCYACSLVKGRTRLLFISALLGVIAMTLAICAIVYTGTTTWRWSQGEEECFLGEVAQGGAYIGAGCYLTCIAVCVGGILSAVMYFAGVRLKSETEESSQ